MNYSDLLMGRFNAMIFSFVATLWGLRKQASLDTTRPLSKDKCLDCIINRNKLYLIIYNRSLSKFNS